jgi:biotin carboxyl carrier protein
MTKRRFKVTVDGDIFLVEIEELEGERSTPLASEIQVTKQSSIKDDVKLNDGIDQVGYVMAPLPGVVSEIRVTKGSQVKKGEVLMVLEAMKMENEIYATVDGMVDTVFAEVGQQVDRGDRLLLISI